MAFHFKWHTAGEKPCYKCSRWNGAIFSSVEALPDLPVHPNCECYVEAFDPNWEELEKLAKEVESIPVQADEKASALRNFLGYSFLRSLFNDIRASMLAFEQVAETGRIFWRNYQDMRTVRLDGADKYFHSKAHAEATQLGKIGEKTAKFIGDMREFTDYYSNIYRKGLSVEATITDMFADLKANDYGLRMGRQNPAKDIEDILI